MFHETLKRLRRAAPKSLVSLDRKNSGIAPLTALERRNLLGTPNGLALWSSVGMLALWHFRLGPLNMQLVKIRQSNLLKHEITDALRVLQRKCPASPFSSSTWSFGFVKSFTPTSDHVHINMWLNVDASMTSSCPWLPTHSTWPQHPHLQWYLLLSSTTRRCEKDICLHWQWRYGNGSRTSKLQTYDFVLAWLIYTDRWIVDQSYQETQGYDYFTCVWGLRPGSTTVLQLPLALTKLVVLQKDQFEPQGETLYWTCWKFRFQIMTSGDILKYFITKKSDWTRSGSGARAILQQKHEIITKQQIITKNNKGMTNKWRWQHDLKAFIVGTLLSVLI